MTMPAQVLKKARELISDEKAWTKGTLARDAKGDPVDEWSQEAVCFCVSGALQRACGGFGFCDATQALRRGSIIRSSIPDWNDAPERTHAEVLATFDKAIALAEGGGE